LHDYLVKAYAFDKFVRIYAARTTDLVNKARSIHDTWPTATAAFGRILTASVIMGAMYKEDQTLTIQVSGDGPVGKIVTTTDAKGSVRGTIENPHIQFSTSDGKLDVGRAIGNTGFIHVTKDLKIRDVFTSSSAIQTGEIGDDFTYYFAMSEQIPSSVGLGVLVGEENEVIASGGFILQLLPGAKPEMIKRIEDAIGFLSPISDLIAAGLTPEQLINEITGGDYEFVEQLDLKYSCDCSKSKFAKSLVTLGKAELESMINEKESIETVCQFCGSKYRFSISDLKQILASAQSKQKKQG
jgi:molecular chaperone Hsp33